MLVGEDEVDSCRIVRGQKDLPVVMTGAAFGIAFLDATNADFASDVYSRDMDKRIRPSTFIDTTTNHTILSTEGLDKMVRHFVLEILQDRNPIF
jgi:hypothetical protein